MDIFKSALAVSRITFSRWKRDVRVKFLFGFTALLIFYRCRPLLEYGLEMHRTSTLYMLPILLHSTTMSLGSTKLLLHVGMVLLLCDAPFFYPGTPYTILRSGRDGWCLGICLYIAAVALVYTAFITAVSSAVLLPVANFTDTWDGVIGDMVFGSSELSAEAIYRAFPHMWMPVKVVQYLYPSGTQMYCFLTIWASFTFLGMLLYLASLVTRNVLLGLGVVGVFVMLDPILVWFSYPRSYWIQIFSPVCWSSPDQLHLLSEERFTTIPFVAVMYPALILLLGLAVWRQSRRTAIGSM